MCVQKLDDSLNSAIHIIYRISLRSSSTPEPRDPLLKVLGYFCACIVSDAPGGARFADEFGCAFGGPAEHAPRGPQGTAAHQSNNRVLTTRGWETRARGPSTR